MTSVNRTSGSGGDATVLVVDDVKRNLQLLGNILGAEHYEVMFAADGPAALERVKARPPDLILLDLMMPGMDGLEVCRRLKRNPETMDIPVIFLTAANDTETATEALDVGAVDFVGKPFDRAELLARVHTHVSLKHTRDELRRIAEEKSALVSAVAHDLKNPIGSVRFSALMLREQGVSGDDPRAALVESIIESCDGALAFIREQLDQSARAVRSRKFRLEDVGLPGVVQRVIQENTPVAHAKGIRLDFAFETGAPALVCADYTALVQILNNLLSNAIKFSPAKSEVKFLVGAPDAEHCVTLRVRDQGPGLSDEDKAHLFEPYRRLSARPTGGESSTGLGLSIARDLATAMQGAIGCDSKQGQGACFWLKLPLPPADRPE